jgi:hypothetical protein
MDFDTPIQKIEKTLAVNRNGLTIHQIMEKTGLARGTVKTYLDELISMSRVHEEEYGQNTKVYFLNGLGKYQQSVSMFEKGYDKGILYVDVMTDPWRNPFIRVKFRRKKKDIGSIYISNEEAVDKLIDVLQKAKPKLKEYRDLITKLEQKVQDT